MATTAKFPPWLRRTWASGQDFAFTKETLEARQLHTVCQSANCPNIGECWGRRTATVMVMGNTCSRNCRYCSVPSGRPEALEAGEPQAVGEAVQRMNLRHTVLTSVTRDDLPDGGADHIAQTVTWIKRLTPGITVEVLVPDFQGDPKAIARVLEPEPEVFSHNIETVRRLYPVIRSRRYTYDLGLSVLRTAAQSTDRAVIKSAFMIGHGETEAEVRETLCDLLEAGCHAVSMGQYLRPSKKQRAVADYVHPDQFKAYEAMAYELGFAFAVAGPFVRSSYRSDAVLDTDFARARLARAGASAALCATK